MLTYKQKHAQANREALATVIGLAATIIVWTLCGFGLSAFDITVCHTPLWVIGGTVGTWVFSIVVTTVLARRVFRNFDLDDEDMTSEQTIRSAGDDAVHAEGAHHE